jgi:hypothetical protein
MPDSKHVRWNERFGTDANAESKADDATLDANEPAANDADGWQQYRRWISKAPTPKGRRSGIDPSLYSWKGYRDWSDQVRRNWSKESTDDKD